MIRKMLAVAATVLLGVSGCSSEAVEPAPQVLVIADEVSVTANGPSWTDLIEERTGAEITLDSEPGSGWLSAGPRAVSDRITEADLVVIALGANDIDARNSSSSLEAAVTNALQAADNARVLVVSPLVAGPAGLEIGQQIERITQPTGATMVAVLLGPEAFAPDGTLTPSGAERVSVAVSDHIQP